MSQNGDDYDPLAVTRERLSELGERAKEQQPVFAFPGASQAPRDPARKTAEIHLGKPYAPPGMKCIFCRKPATRTSTTIEGSITIDGVKRGFAETGTHIHFCDDHGIFTLEQK